MRSRFARVAVVFATGLTVAVGVVFLAGKGTINPGHCKPCFPEPQGCRFFECDNRSCNYTCTAADGSTYSLSLPRQGGGS